MEEGGQKERGIGREKEAKRAGRGESEGERSEDRRERGWWGGVLC